MTRGGDTVFCKIDEVWRLFRALRRTCKRIVLVTGEGDKPVTPDLCVQKPPHVHHWLGMNMFAEDPAATPIPLGLGEEGHPATLDWKDIAETAKQSLARTGSLYAGAIPVVRDSWAMRNFRDLPILLVPRLDGISEDSLRAPGQTGGTKSASRAKLDLAF